MIDPLSSIISLLSRITDHIFDYPRWLKRSLVKLSDAVIYMLSILLRDLVPEYGPQSDEFIHETSLNAKPIAV